MAAPKLDDYFELGPLLFTQPTVLAAGGAVVAALIAALVYDDVRRGKLLGRAGQLASMRAMVASASPLRRRLKAGLIVLAAAGVAIALADPRVKRRTEIASRGLDLVLAVDVSKSMMVGDVPPSRLDQAREMVKTYLRKPSGDRVAAVVFAGAAVNFPLTDDREATARFLTDFGPNDMPGGSDLGEAIRVSRCLLRPDLYDQLGCPGLVGRRGHGGDPLPGDRWDDDEPRRRGGILDDEDDDEPEEPAVEKEERGRAIVLFTDGADDESNPAEEIVIARQLGIDVFVIGFGTEAGGEVWDTDDFGNATSQKFDEQGRPVISRRDDAGMLELAAAAGDPSHYWAPPSDGTVDVAPLERLLSTVKRGLSAQRVKQARPVFHWFLFPAFMLLVVEALIATRRRKVALP
jgi:Ca-activated chloride channel family protein